jgi:hypothetical protein
MATSETMDVKCGTRDGYVVTFQGKELKIPESWELLPPGDAGLTRRVKKDGPHWVVKDFYKKRWISRGVLAPADRIEFFRGELDGERKDPAYAKKLDAGRKRREKQEGIYAEDFAAAVRDFLSFDPTYSEMAAKLSEMIAKHATPVGSGTVARTKRIPIETRAEAATIAWLRHQTTSYDHMHIARVAGERREVRRMLAEESRRRLSGYRQGLKVSKACPIWRVVYPDG